MPRKTGKIRSNRTILLVVEGETEQKYFSEMKCSERIPGITISPKMAAHSSLYHILKMALSEQASLVYDSIWCVFDCDVILQDGLTLEVQRMMRKARSVGIRFADSLPSFEIWYLLHYVLPRQQYASQDAVIKELQRYIPGYEKTVRWLTHAQLYSKLKPLHQKAMDNNGKLVQRTTGWNGNGDTFCKVYAIFKELGITS